jgi:hypothetical protein
MIKSIPYYSKYDIMIIGEGLSFNKMSEEIKLKFKRAIISLENIDDRLNIEWNKIHILNKKEEKIKDFLNVKNSENQYDSKDIISLNLNDDGNGISILADDVNNKEKNLNLNQNNIDSLFNNNNDKAKTSLQISQGKSVDNLYTKIFDLKNNNNNINNNNTSNNNTNIINNNDKKKFINKNALFDYGDFLQNFNENNGNTGQKDISANDNEIIYNNNKDNRNFNNYLNFNEKISRILKDPVIFKLEKYIENFKDIDTKNTINNNDNSFDINFIEIKNKNKNKIKSKIRNNKIKNKNKEEDKEENKNKENDCLSKKIFKEQYMKKLEKLIDEKIKNSDKSLILPRFKEKYSEINFEDKYKNLSNKKKENISNINISLNYNKNDNDNNKIRIRNLFIDDLSYCFNKDYYSKEFKFYGKGNFEKCLKFVEKLNTNKNLNDNKINMNLKMNKNMNMNMKKNPNNYKVN